MERCLWLHLWQFPSRILTGWLERAAQCSSRGNKCGRAWWWLGLVATLGHHWDTINGFICKKWLKIPLFQHVDSKSIFARLLPFQHLYWAIALPLLRVSWLLQSIQFVAQMNWSFYDVSHSFYALFLVLSSDPQATSSYRTMHISSTLVLGICPILFHAWS